MEGGHIHISLAPEIIGHLGQLSVTNTLLMSLIATVLLGTLAFFVSRKVSLKPSKLQTTMEMIVGGVADYTGNLLEDRKLTEIILPLLLSIFFFVLTINWIQFIPGVGSVGFWTEDHAFEPLFRGAAADLNLTLALAAIAFFAIEFAGFYKLGAFHYIGKFLNFKSALGFGIGIIDLFSELARLVSFSFRLFGNIFAGEVIIAIIIFFAPWLVPIPFLGFEIFVGFIQASIFALLTLFFIKIATTEAH